MKTTSKIALGIVLGFVLLIGSCAAIVGGAAGEIDKEVTSQLDEDHSDGAEHAMSEAKYREVKTGVKYDDFVKTYGEPDPDQTQEIEVDGLHNVTVYYNVEGGEFLDMYQFSFDNGVLSSKSHF